MIELMSDLPGGVLGFTAIGKVTGADYERVLVPAVEAALKEHDKLALVYHCGDDFSGFDAGAMWDDAKVGLRHITSWRRIAVVTDIGWLRTAVRAFAAVLRDEAPARPPWAASFDRAEARSEEGDPESMLRDWLGDEIWSLEWAFRGASFAQARREHVTRAAAGRRLAERWDGRPDRVMAEAIAVLELVGLAEPFRERVASLPEALGPGVP